MIERFRDEIGDWRVVVHSPYGAQVHAPWALAVAARLRERFGIDVQAMHADDGIVLRLPDLEVEDVPGGSLDVADLVLMEPDTVEDLVTAEVGGSALFAARFRECAARALLLPRRRPDRRQPLWQQRQRAAQLLQVASRYASFPIVLETVRECLQDVYDVPGLVALQRDLAARRVRDRRGRDADPVAVRPEPALRLRRGVPLRGRLAARRAARRRAGARPDAARRAARSRRGGQPARPARPGGAGPHRGRAAAADPRASGPRPRGRRRPGPPAGADHDGRGRRPQHGPGGGPALAGRARGQPPADPGAGRPARSAGPRSRTPAGCGTRSARRCRWACPRRSWRRRPTRWRPGRALRPLPRPVHRPRPGRPGWASASRSCSMPCAGWSRPGRLVEGELRPLTGTSDGGGTHPGSAHRGAGWTTATPRCCAPCAGARWPRCGPRSSRCPRSSWPGSCPDGRASAVGCAAAKACCAWSSSSPARCCRPARSRPWCCRPGSRATSRPSWTS